MNKLAKNEAKNYITVIDSLTVHIALVDKKSNILAVNKSWKNFAEKNSKGNTNYEIGKNYLSLFRGINKDNCLCQKEVDDFNMAQEIHKGLKDVLNGKIENFKKEYPCDSPTEHRWFSVTINPFPITSNLGAIISHENITKEKEAEDAQYQKTLEMSSLFKSMIKTIAVLVEKKDPYTAGHQREVARISKLIAQELGWPEEKIFGLYLGATIHDIGKIAIPSEMLCKPTRLSAAEHILIHEHSTIGSDIVKNINFPWPIQKMIEQHHERIDGSGYPHGLKNNQICDEAKVLAVADVFEAITAHRPYRPAKSRSVALKELIENKGIFYDSEVVDALLRVIKKKKLGKTEYELN